MYTRTRIIVYNIHNSTHLFIYLYTSMKYNIYLNTRLNIIQIISAEDGQGGFPQPPINAVIIRLSNARYRGTRRTTDQSPRRRSAAGAL